VFIKYKIRRFNKLPCFLFAFLAIALFACRKEDDIPPLQISGEVYHVSEFGNNDGSILITTDGGIAPLKFMWSTGDTTRDLTTIPAGIYHVKVSDKKLQSVTDTFEVLQPQPIGMVVLFTVTHPSETGEQDGKINTMTGGGYPPFSYQWSTGAITENLEGLSAGIYSVTVSDSRGQSFTDSVHLEDKVYDTDGNSYSIKKIGNQTWMQENLKVTHAPDSSTLVSYVYNDNPDNEVKYGRLYTWSVAMNQSTEEKARGICPVGWHIPSDNDFKILEMALGMSQAQANMENTWRGAPAGTMMKAGGSSGYEALLSGSRTSGGAFGLMGRMEYVWTSSESGSANAWRRCLDSYSPHVGRWNTFPKSYAFSVRCVKDD
jgi:uncharacterized protein (TIGR02145 family)